jgi:hypothetical protein
VRERGGGQRERRQPGPVAARIGTVGETQEKEGEADPVRVRELAGEGAGEGSAPDGILLGEQEDERPRGAEQRHRGSERHETQRGIGEKRQCEHAEDAADLERRRQPEERGEAGHDHEREREVIEQEGMTQVGPRVPAVEAQVRQERGPKVDEGREVARCVAARGDRREEKKRRPEVVDKDEQDRPQAEEVDEEGTVPPD